MYKGGRNMYTEASGNVERMYTAKKPCMYFDVARRRNDAHAERGEKKAMFPTTYSLNHPRRKR